MSLNPRFFDCADTALLVDFGPHYNQGLSLAILSISERLRTGELTGFLESIPALSSLTVFYDPLKLSKGALIEHIESVCGETHAALDKTRTWEIPVVYGGASGPDFEEVARQVGLTAEALIDLHTKPTYFVYMLGFLPGFAYLGDVPSDLRLPRRKTPRARVPAGSVAIASDMTAIYPLESPGGWHILGNTPILLWDMARKQEPLFRPGDRICFKPISEQEAAILRERALNGWSPDPIEAE